MYRKIVVPLDGTDLAETVIPHVLKLAQICESPDIILVRVVEPAPAVIGDYVVKTTETTRINNAGRDEAEQYLKNIAGHVDWGLAMVETKVLEGHPAQAIADFASTLDDDVIVLATHARAGVKRFVLGSVADEIVRDACVPVMMVRAPGCAPGL